MSDSVHWNFAPPPLWSFAAYPWSVKMALTGSKRSWTQTWFKIGLLIRVKIFSEPLLQLKSLNYGQSSMTITLSWVNPVMWPIAYQLISEHLSEGIFWISCLFFKLCSFYCVHNSTAVTVTLPLRLSQPRVVTGGPVQPRPVISPSILLLGQWNLLLE